MVSNHFQNMPMKPDLPYVECRSNEHADCFRVHYGVALGWRDFDADYLADADLVNFIDARVAKMAHEMFELTRLKRKVMK